MGDPISFGAAFTIGLLGGAHCVGMCGGIMNALGFAIPVEKRRGATLSLIVLSYNAGRIFSYVLAGIIIGLLGAWFQQALAPLSLLLRILAGLLLIAMGLYLAGWWLGLRHLEHAGGMVWQHIEPVAKKLMPVTRPGQALLLGTLWGWLPCGLVYSVLTWSAAAGDALTSGLVMLGFGLGTLPVMFVTGRFAQVLKAFVQRISVRRVAGMLVIAFGLWTIAGVFLHSGQHNQASQTSGHDFEIHHH